MARNGLKEKIRQFLLANIGHVIESHYHSFALEYEMSLLDSDPGRRMFPGWEQHPEGGLFSGEGAKNIMQQIADKAREQDSIP
jgi:hypothetical protein